MAETQRKGMGLTNLGFPVIAPFQELVVYCVCFAEPLASHLGLEVHAGRRRRIADRVGSLDRSVELVGTTSNVFVEMRTILVHLVVSRQSVSTRAHSCISVSQGRNPNLQLSLHLSKKESTLRLFFAVDTKVDHCKYRYQEYPLSPLVHVGSNF